ncbi:MAG: sugar ABC transporter permease [Thermomicrobiales bacterium]
MAYVSTAHRRPGKWSRIGEGLGSWLFLLPAVGFFVLWQLWPVILVGWYSFTDFRFLNPASTTTVFGLPTGWVGLANFREALNDDLVWEGLKRAAIFTALFVPGMILIPLVIATLVDRVRHGKIAGIYRVILLIPAMIPGPLVFVLWKWLYDLYIGPINYFLVDVFHFYTIRDQPQWLGDPHLVFFSIAFMEWWWGIGYHTMFFIAGLAAIPHDLIEAARLDGASEVRLWWNIVVPRLMPVILVLVVVRFGSAMAVIDEYLIVGGFNRTKPTYTWTVYMWETAFVTGEWRQGYAAAIGWIGALAMLIVVVGMFYFFRSRD